MPSLVEEFIECHFKIGHFVLVQAGLSRATLEISSEFSSNFPLRNHTSQSIQWLLRYSVFDNFIWRVYIIWIGQINLSLKFEYDPISGL